MKSEQATTAGAAGSTSGGGDAHDQRLARLTRAGELRDSGVLTQTEFEAMKAEILGN